MTVANLQPRLLSGEYERPGARRPASDLMPQGPRKEGELVNRGLLHVLFDGTPLCPFVPPRSWPEVQSLAVCLPISFFFLVTAGYSHLSL